jgi:SNF2 family DNA or RNA helicase
LVEHLHQRAGRLSVLVNGSVTGVKRQAAIDRFQTDSTCLQLTGNLAAAGVGLTLTAAETVAFFQFGWTPGGITQAEDRCWGRLNDLHGANVFFLVARGTIEEKLLEITQGKQEITTRVLDGEAGGEKLDVYDQLTLALLAERKGNKR